MKGIKIKALKKLADKRGWLAEIFRPEDVNKTIKGQICITVAEPGMIKANHYHKKKYEWYFAVKGKMRLVLKDMKTGKKEEFVLSDRNLRIMEIPPYVAHGFKNIGKDNLYLLIYNDEPYHKEDPDTYTEIVMK